MADKIFIGKVEEKTFNNGGSIIKLNLSPKDKALLNSSEYVTVEIKKSTKGNWYAEVSQRPVQPTQMRSNYSYSQPQNIIDDNPDDLPF
jgi:hypothetical protein